MDDLSAMDNDERGARKPSFVESLSHKGVYCRDIESVLVIGSQRTRLGKSGWRICYGRPHHAQNYKGERCWVYPRF
jgi:hypothetical protein